MIVGHCGKECTNKGIPEGGEIYLFNTLLHTHLAGMSIITAWIYVKNMCDFINDSIHKCAGRKMKLRHFRNETELPWVSYDGKNRQLKLFETNFLIKYNCGLSFSDHYHFNYQKNRPLREERKILPGDSLTFGKNYNKTHRIRRE